MLTTCMCFKKPSWAFSYNKLSISGLSFNASELMDNKYVCDRVVNNVGGNCSLCKIKLTGYNYS